jgi:ABC-type polysaccharide/polyol phosphate transport system ATPase subunit
MSSEPEREVAISVEGLGKSYRLRHRSGESYLALRDVIARKVRAAGRALLRRGSIERKEDEEEFWALRDVSFDVHRGEVLGIIGRNGAGKSTLLKLLSRITEPTAGRIRIRGRVASLLEVGTGFHPELTGRENIFLNGAILGMARADIRRQFDDIVAFAEVERFLDTPVKRYSSGMYVRLAFAVAAHLDPEILVIDEVLAVGDAEFQRKCLGKMKNVAGSGRTVLFVSHSMTAVSQLCDRGILLRNGRVEAFTDDVPGLVAHYLASAQEGQHKARSAGDTILADARLVSLVESPSGWVVTFEVMLSERPRLARIGIDFVVRHNEMPLAFGGSAYFSSIEIDHKTHRLKCAFGPLNFALGTYQVDLRVCDPMRSWLEEHDAIMEFSIERQLGSPHLFTLEADRDLGLIVAPQEWSVVE